MRKTKTALTGIAISFAVLAVMVAALVAFDLRLHSRFDKISGLNYRGYRGSVLGKKVPGEVRIGMFGGSVAMGYGTKYEASIAALLERDLNDRTARTGRPGRYTVANLASNQEPELDYFKANYELFRYLDLDVLIFYVADDTSTLSVANGEDVDQVVVSRRSSDPVLASFGYFFVFPTVVREKYYMMRYGSIEKGYANDSILDVFHRVLKPVQHRETKATGSLSGFIKEMLRSDKKVIFALAPDLGPDVRRNLRHSFQELFPDSQGVALADMESVFPPTDRSSYYLDGMHFSEKGNGAIAERLALRLVP